MGAHKIAMDAEPEPPEGADRVQDLSIFKLPPGFRGRNAVIVQLWWIVQSTLFRWSPQVMYGWRAWLLRLFGAKIGRRVLIRPGTHITYPWKLKCGDYVWIGDGTELYNLADIEIGSHVAIAHDVAITTGSHMFRQKTFDIYALPIVIEDECWLCAGSFIHQGVTLAKGSVIGARAVIQKSTEPYSINAGFPSRQVGTRAPGAAA
jgi:putative colanic acid biosynthesis acetyltransferase WcaF